MPEKIVKVTPQQFRTVQEAMRPERVYGASSYDTAAAALPGIGIEPVDGTTYRFVVNSD